MRFSVEMTVTDGGTTREGMGYLRDSDMELTDLLQWTKTTLILVSDRVLKEEQAKGFDRKPVLVVDGRRNKPIQDVSPLGQIEFVARTAFGPLLLETYESLLHRSKVLTGAYIRSHFVFWKGIQVASDLQSLKQWLATSPAFKEGDAIRIVNTQPYARRLELLGVTAQRSNPRSGKKRNRDKTAPKVTIKVPNGAYQLTVRAIQAKYKQNLSVKFAFLPGNGFGQPGVFKTGKKGARGRPYLFPTIVFKIVERGLK